MQVETSSAAAVTVTAPVRLGLVSSGDAKPLIRSLNLARVESLALARPFRRRRATGSARRSARVVGRMAERVGVPRGAHRATAHAPARSSCAISIVADLHRGSAASSLERVVAQLPATAAAIRVRAGRNRA